MTQEEFKKIGYQSFSISLPGQWRTLVKDENYQELDQLAKDALTKEGHLYEFMKSQIADVFSQSKVGFEHILSLRVGPEDEELDGIWHDDGSRLLAFSMSLNLDYKTIEGGHLSLRKKASPDDITNINVRDFGTLTIFCTGQQGWEHKTNLVSQGKRLVLAGWLT